MPCISAFFNQNKVPTSSPTPDPTTVPTPVPTMAPTPGSFYWLWKSFSIFEKGGDRQACSKQIYQTERHILTHLQIHTHTHTHTGTHINTHTHTHSLSLSLTDWHISGAHTHTAWNQPPTLIETHRHVSHQWVLYNKKEKTLNFKSNRKNNLEKKRWFFSPILGTFWMCSERKREKKETKKEIERESEEREDREWGERRGERERERGESERRDLEKRQPHTHTQRERERES